MPEPSDHTAVNSPPSEQGSLVSILIPTHNRPDYLREALDSVLAQTHRNLDIVISDNGSSDESLEALRDIVAADPRIRYIRGPERNHYLDNWLHALSHARGDYVNFLMDDDLYHPEKVSRMVAIYEQFPDVGLVTSHRALIDSEGRPLPAISDTEHLFGGDAAVIGDEMARQILLNGRNVVGEPTTVLLRREELGAAFGFCLGRQYQVLSDIATWLRMMRGRRVVWLHDSLSLFRIHAGQDQRRSLQQLWASVEWLQLLLDADKAGWLEGHDELVRASLKIKLDVLVPYITQHAAQLREGPGHVETIQRLVRQALDRLLH